MRGRSFSAFVQKPFTGSSNFPNGGMAVLLITATRFIKNKTKKVSEATKINLTIFMGYDALRGYYFQPRNK